MSARELLLAASTAAAALAQAADAFPDIELHVDHERLLLLAHEAGQPLRDYGTMANIALPRLDRLWGLKLEFKGVTVTFLAREHGAGEAVESLRVVP